MFFEKWPVPHLPAGRRVVAKTVILQNEPKWETG
jgi:hypothetical protein